MKNRQEKISEYGQKTITGKITLTKDLTLFNNSNYGKTPQDYNWNKIDRIEMKAGTEVNYRGEETRSYFLHTVWVKVGNNVFSAKKTDENHPCCK